MTLICSIPRKPVIETLHQDGRSVICYFSAGSYEDWRPDEADFPASVRGKPLDNWPGESWLDIRQIDTLSPIMGARLDLAVQKGCDGVEPDNVDGYSNDTGFPLTAAHQLAYNIWLAEEAHARGLSIGLKNDLDQIPELLPYFDWALNEQCFEYEECDCCCHLSRLAKRCLALNIRGNWLIFVLRPLRTSSVGC